MEEPLDISILIPVHDIAQDQAQMTRVVLESAVKASQGIAAEIIVIDDKSPCKDAFNFKIDTTRYIKLLQIQDHPGLASALNYGATIARGSILTYCHSDCLLQVDTIERILHLFRDPAIGLGMSELWYPNGDLQQVGGWIGPGFRLAWDKTLSSSARHTHWGDFWSVRSRLFNEVGCLPTCYNPGYWECVDLAVNIRMKGYQVMTCPNSKVIHLKSQTFHRLLTEKERASLFERNRRIFTDRWRSSESDIIKGVPVSIREEEWR